VGAPQCDVSTNHGPIGLAKRSGSYRRAHRPFWIEFFEIFGITDKRVATFELNIKKLGDAQGFIDLFWPSVLFVEHKSRGKNLNDAVDQAIGYRVDCPSPTQACLPISWAER
jgi:hypothetical protein